MKASKASPDYTDLLTDTHVYTNTYAQSVYIICIVLAIVILGPAMFLSKSKSTPLLGIVIIGGMLAVYLTAFFVFGRVRLITGREGLIYVGLRRTVFTPWENIVKVINMSRGGGMLQMRVLPEQLDLEQGIREHRAAIETKNKLMSSQKSYSPYDSYHLIPLLRPGLPSRKSKLGQDLLHYAPQVYGEDAGSTSQMSSRKSA